MRHSEKRHGFHTFRANNIFVRKPMKLLEIVRAQKTIVRTVSEPYHVCSSHPMHSGRAPMFGSSPRDHPWEPRGSNNFARIKAKPQLKLLGVKIDG